MDLTLAAIVILSVWVVGIVAAGLVLTLRPGGAGIRFGPASNKTAAGERGEILLGGEAEVLGNPRGTVRSVQIDPASRRLLALELGGGLAEGEEIPASAIVEADGQVLSLAERWEALPVDEQADVATLRSNVSVVTSDGKRIGRLKVVCFDQASEMVTALVAAGRGTSTERLVPMDRVVEAGDERVLTNLAASDIGALQVFETDWDLRQEIDQRLGADAELRRALRVEIVDQRVRVEGYVADRSQVERLATLLRSIPGILQLDLQVRTDADLAQAVQDAISHDPLTANVQVQVTAQTGVVDIAGQAPDRATARRIEAAASQVPGVEVVHNFVSVKPATAAAS